MSFSLIVRLLFSLLSSSVLSCPAVHYCQLLCQSIAILTLSPLAPSLLSLFLLLYFLLGGPVALCAPMFLNCQCLWMAEHCSPKIGFAYLCPSISSFCSEIFTCTVMLCASRTMRATWRGCVLSETRVTFLLVVQHCLRAWWKHVGEKCSSSDEPSLVFWTKDANIHEVHWTASTQCHDICFRLIPRVNSHVG